MIKILCLDDDKDFCAFLESLFETNEGRFVKVHSVQAAFKRLAEEEFDAVLLDRDLPDGSGIEVAEALKQNRGRRPVLALITGSKISIPDYLVFKKKLKIDFIMSKPLLPPLAETFAKDLLKKVAAARTGRRTGTGGLMAS